MPFATWFGSLAAATLVLTLTAGVRPAESADGSTRTARIGILSNVPMTDAAGLRVWGAFIQGLRDLGYVEGRNVEIVHRSSEGMLQRLPELAAELVRARVDVIVAPATHNVLVARQATATIPIVMAGAGDAVAAGLVTSLARPGGNVTGVSLVPSLDIAGKRLALLKEVVPSLSRVATLGNPANEGGYRRSLDPIQSASRALALSLHAVEAPGPDGLERAFATMTRERAGAVVVMADGMSILHRKRIVDLAARHRLPAIYEFREFVDAGGLLVYGPSMRDSFRRAASYVDRILKGASPADLPIEQATRFELIVNLSAAKALNLKIPGSVVQRADEVIE